MRRLRDRVAAVTGAGSGIGRALAVRLAGEGMRLALADMDQAGLAETLTLLPAGQASAHRVDVARAEEVAAFAAAVEREHGGAHLLINNAGVAAQGRFEELSAADFDHVLAVNLGGVIHGARAFLPQLRAKEEAHLVNLSSVFGLVGPRGQTAYAASKFAVRGFTEALAGELAGSPVRVSVVHPGGVATRIAARARRAEAVDAERARRMVEEFEQVARTTAEQAAARIVRGIQRNQHRILVGADAHALDLFIRLLPGRSWLMRLLEM